MKKIVEIYEKDNRRIVKGLGNGEPDQIRDIKHLVNKTVEKFGDKVAFKYKKNGTLVEKSYIDFQNDINNLGTKLYDMKLKGEKIAIIGDNSYKWCVSYLSVINGIGIGVPLDKSLPQEEIENLIERSRVRAIFFSKSYEKIMRNISKNIDIIDYYICFDELEETDKKFINMQQLIEQGEKLVLKGNRDFIDAEIDPNVMSILLFTSGTTKRSKGVMLSHNNVASNISAITGVMRMYETDTHLSLLPIHHTFENVVGFLYMFNEGVCIAYCEGIRHIASNLKEFDVTILLAVPAIYEAIYSKLKDGLKKSKKEFLVSTLKMVANTLFSCGIDIRRKMLAPVRNQLAPNLRLMVSAAAPIDKKIITEFESMGIMFLQGYGLTETSPLVAVTTEDTREPGIVGPPASGIKITIDNPDKDGMGELLVKGHNVMLGYYEEEEETREVFTEDGWFRTGDLGIIDKNGLLRITGRTKSMIVFANGKKAFPEEYEDILNKISGIKESFVWGSRAKDGDVQISVKLVVQDDCKIEEMTSKIEQEIKNINKKLPKYKIIRYFVLTKKELIKTTTLKIKRNIERNRMEEYLQKMNCDMRKLNKSFID